MKRLFAVLIVSLLLGNLLPALPISASAAPIARAAKSEWTVMLYQDADDPVLEMDILLDLNEAELIGSTEAVEIVAQVDRFKGAYDGMGDWTGAKRYHVEQNLDLTEIGSAELVDMGEVNMADGETLVDFIDFAVNAYPARKYALILSDHGAGWPGGYSDPDPEGPGNDDVPFAELLGDSMWLHELDWALAAARERTGIEKFDLIGFDACLMGQLEVYAALIDDAQYAVASEEVEPSLGWAYAQFLDQLASNPEMDGGELGTAIVESYIDQDAMVQVDAMRAAVADGMGLDPAAPVDEVAAAKGADVTLAMVDLAAIPDVVQAVDELAAAMAGADPKTVGQARMYCQTFKHIFGEDVPSTYIDLGNMATFAVEASGDPVLAAAGQAVLDAMKAAVVAEKHGPERPGASGICIYFPFPEVYEKADNFGYTTHAAAFVAMSSWDEFLHAYNTGESFVAEEGAVPIERPADEASPLLVTDVAASAERTDVDNPVTLTTDVSGGMLAFIYTFFGRIVEEENVIQIEDMDFLVADETKDVGGVPYPVWEETVPVDFDWTPVTYAISDGTQEYPALFSPEDYGTDESGATYSVEGVYTPLDGSEPMYAVLLFQGDELVQALAYTGPDDLGAMAEITPEVGDQFTIMHRGISLDENAPEDEDLVWDGDTLTFGDANLTMVEVPAPAGDYVVGFIAEDLDGNTSEAFTTVTVDN